MFINKEKEGEHELSLSVCLKIVMLTVEMIFALVLDQVTVAKVLTMILVLVWVNVQPLTPTLGPMMTSFVVSGDTPSISLNFTCSFISKIDWLNVINAHTHPCTKTQSARFPVVLALLRISLIAAVS